MNEADSVDIIKAILDIYSPSGKEQNLATYLEKKLLNLGFINVRKDKVGNIAQPVFDTITVDTAPPDLITCSINRGDPITNTTLVTLDVIANDNTSGIFRISFSNDGQNWTGWEQYAETVKYDLPPGDGKKSIHVKLMDNAYNIGNTVSDSIHLESLPTDTDSLPAKKSTDSSIDYWFIFVLIIIVLLILIYNVKQNNYINIASKNLNQIQRHKDYLFDNNLELYRLQ